MAVISMAIHYEQGHSCLADAQLARNQITELARTVEATSAQKSGYVTAIRPVGMSCENEL